MIPHRESVPTRPPRGEEEGGGGGRSTVASSRRGGERRPRAGAQNDNRTIPCHGCIHPRTHARTHARTDERTHAALHYMHYITNLEEVCDRDVERGEPLFDTRARVIMDAMNE